MKNALLPVILTIAAVAASACTGFERQSGLTAPTAAGNNSMLGSWTSSSIIPTPSTCTDFKWTVSEQTALAAKGAFSATCAGDLKLTGIAQGGFTTASAIAWSAQGNATGPGLTSAQAHSVFERRYPTGSRPLPIGLYVSRKIVEAHGGEVGVDSTPSVGATFWFALPVQAWAGRRAPASPVTRHRPPERPGRLLAGH